MFDRQDVRRAIGEPAFSRGLDYFLRGRVRSLEFDGPTRLRGRVSGTRASDYSVSVILSLRGHGLRVEGSCSCPVGYNCKHVAALLLSACEGRQPQSGASDWASSLPHEVRRWLDLWPSRGSKVTKVREPGSLVPGQDHLFYVIRYDTLRGMHIDPCRAYLKKDGSISRNVRPFDRRSTWARENLTVQDAALLGKLAFFSGEEYEPRYDWPEGGLLVDLVREIVETGRARLGGIHGMALVWGASRAVAFVWELDETGAQRLAARDADGGAVTLLPFPTPLFVDAGTGEMGATETALPPDIAAWLATAPPVPREAVDAVASKLSRMGQRTPVPRLHRVEERLDVAPEPVLVLHGREHKVIHWAAGGYGLKPGRELSAIWPFARLEIAYAGVERRVHPGEDGDLRLPGDGAVIIRRDHEREAAYQKRLDALAHPFRQDMHQLRYAEHDPPREVWDADVVFPPLSKSDGDDGSMTGLAFHAQAVPVLRTEGWRVEIDRTWPFRLHEGPVAFSTSLEETETDWFSLRLSMEVNGESFDMAPIVQQIVADLPVDEWGQLAAGFDTDRHLSGRTFHARLEDGTFLALDGSRFARFAEAFLEAQGLLGFHRAEAGRLSVFAEALEGCGAPWAGGRELLELGARLRALAEASDMEVPAALQGELRPYQRMGWAWLQALSETSFGGVLADDMGLGKTVQALALLAWRHLEAKVDRPSLLVVPTSLVGNWKREAARFVPDLKLLVLHGPDRRTRFADIPGAHLVVTTYPLLNRDGAALFGHRYDTAMLDEAHTVKNPAAGVAKRIREIDARHRVALTGTPLENNLQELWALYDWLIPGLLGNRKSFTRNYRTPIEKKSDRARQRLLAARIEPFLMRRTKEEVAPELPKKTVIDELVPFGGAQAALYESIRMAMDRKVRKAIAARGLAASRIAILDALLKLRQVCCDPRLVKLDAARKVTESAKRARLLALLEELVAENRKVLVFSQFVEMLKLIEGDIAARGWGYAMLHGGTRDRDGRIAAFQSGALPLFLISLKAGGAGLNLTAADTVIVYDPWWNPAAERQAMDRAHRIGQDKPVFVHRLIAENTVEAAIQVMQARKQALADALFEGAARGPLALTEDDMVALFGTE